MEPILIILIVLNAICITALIVFQNLKRQLVLGCIELSFTILTLLLDKSYNINYKDY